MKKNNLVTKLISAYQIISQVLPSCCRFYPSCSVYAKEVFQYAGFNISSILLVIKRLLRCQPFCEGGFDPVPNHIKKESIP